MTSDEILGKFTYKFKEGHSKNFKRELTIDYFLGGSNAIV